MLKTDLKRPKYKDSKKSLVDSLGVTEVLGPKALKELNNLRTRLEDIPIQVFRRH